MNRRRLSVRTLAVASATLVVLSGCGLPGTGSGHPAAANGAGDLPTPSAGASASMVSGLGTSESAGGSESPGTSESPSGDLPDPCTLLSRSEVTSLTGRDITETDPDGAKPGDTARYCQWQQDGGQLALFLARTTDEDFHTTITDADSVDGVDGHDAFTLAGHLYVLDGGLQIDVYSRGGSDAQNLTDETEVVKTVLPRL